MREWQIRARNLAEHARNRIHTDEGAREAGYPGALVAGVTTYAYLCHPLIEAWGTEWVERGGCELRLRAPVFRDDLVRCRPSTAGEDGSVTIDAVVDDPLVPRASLRAWRVDDRSPEERPGEPLPVHRFALDQLHGPDYGVRAGDDLELLISLDIVHPAAWVSLANGVFSRELVRGPWIHTRSRITHHGIAHSGADVVITSRVVRRFVRSGERAVADLGIHADGRLVCSIEHEAIIDLSIR